MKNTIITFLSAFLFCSCPAQQNYIDYHKKIIKAEVAFMAWQMPLSMKIYKEAFEAYRPFAKDCFIAAQIAAMINDTNSVRFFLAKGFEVGVPFILLHDSKYLNKLLRNEQFKIACKKMYDSCRTRYLKSFDISLRKRFTEMSKKDGWGKMQIKMERKNFSEAGTQYVTISGDTEYVQVLEENIQEVIRISKELGYVPGEKTLGVMDADLDGRDGKLITKMLTSQLNQLCFHHGCGFILLQKEMIESVKRGELHPRTYALMYEWAYQDLKDKSYRSDASNFFPMYKIKCPPPPKDKYYNHWIQGDVIEKTSCDDIPFVNACRDEIGMSSIAHDKRKKEFAKAKGLILFFGLFGPYFPDE